MASLFTPLPPELSENDETEFWGPYGFLYNDVTPFMESSFRRSCELEPARSRKWIAHLSNVQRKTNTSDLYCGLQLDKRTKTLVRDGVAVEHRGGVWMALSGARRLREANVDHYAQLVVNNASRKTDYTDLIESDLRRTFPKHQHIHSKRILERMRRILVAYSFHNPSLGYTQSLNYIVFVFLAHTDITEEDCFWLLTALIDKLPPNYYKGNLSGVQIDQQVLIELAKWKGCAFVIEHIEKQGAGLNFFTTDWFMCLFSKTLSPPCVFRIIDCIVSEGPKILFRVGVAILRLMQDHLLRTTDLTSTSNILGSLDKCIAEQPLFDMTFKSMGTFSWNKVIQIRTQVRPKIFADLRIREQRKQAYYQRPEPPNSLDIDLDDATFEVVSPRNKHVC
ncbi:hypothetical protein PCE1_001189 [Barthelona sp. PCE]